MRYYQFADQVNDPKNIKANPDRAKAISVSEKEIIDVLSERGAMSNVTRQNMWTHKFYNILVIEGGGLYLIILMIISSLNIKKT